MSSEKTFNSKNDNNDQKLFIGGLNWETGLEEFKKYFEELCQGKISDVRMPLNPNTGNPRGFGFVAFDNKEDYDNVIEMSKNKTLIILGKNVEAKPVDKNHPRKGLQNSQRGFYRDPSKNRAGGRFMPGYNQMYSATPPGFSRIGQYQGHSSGYEPMVASGLQGSAPRSIYQPGEAYQQSATPYYGQGKVDAQLYSQATQYGQNGQNAIYSQPQATYAQGASTQYDPNASSSRYSGGQVQAGFSQPSTAGATAGSATYAQMSGYSQGAVVPGDSTSVGYSANQPTSSAGKTSISGQENMYQAQAPGLAQSSAYGPAQSTASASRTKGYTPF